MIDFYYDIEPKPVGNWRPKITFGYSWDAKDVAHNPCMRKLYIISPSPNSPSSSRNKDKLISMIPPEIISKNILVTFLMPNSKGEPWAFYSEPHLGKKIVFNDLQFEFLSSMIVVENGFINNKGSKEIIFYGPWKNCEEPDYSEVINLFENLRQVIFDMLMDGSRSGESNHLKDKIVYSDGDWVKESELNERKRIAKKARKIDL